jgi:hypothetical protein
MARTRARTHRRHTAAHAPTILDRIREAPKLAAAIGAIVALAAGVLGLVSWFFPDAKPKPRAPTNAGLEMLDFQKHVTLGRYLRSIGATKTRYTAAQLARDGIVATVKADNVSGVKRADLYWTMRDAASGGELADDHYVHQLAAHFKIRTTGDSGGRAFWVPAPPQPGRYFVRFELDAAGGTILASQPTDAFVVG